MATVHLIGGEKGGVGKSVVARVLAQYMIDNEIPFVGFDTDKSHGSLLRFYADYASPTIIDSYESLDAIIEVAAQNSNQRVLVDLAAQTHQAFAKWIDESGVLELAEELDIKIYYWNVMDSGVKERALAFNAQVMILKRLHAPVMTKIDSNSYSFWAAKNKDDKSLDALGLLERQRVKIWLNHAYKQIESVGV